MLTQKRLHQLVTYNRRTGAMRWRQDHGACAAGDPIPRTKTLSRATLDGESYLIDHLVWLYVTGALPTCQLRRLPGTDKYDRRFRVLYETTIPLAQPAPRHSPPPPDTSGMRWVPLKRDSDGLIRFQN